VETTRSAKHRPLTRAVGENLAYWRKERGLSLAELSARLDDVGVPMNLNGLHKIERGNRGVDIDELVAIARALDVPPLHLLFPIGRDQTSPLLPDHDVPAWPAAKWFTGEGPFPGASGHWNTPLRDFRHQDRVIERWSRSLTGTERTDLEDDLRVAREHIRGWGLDPGPLPAELAHVDGARDGER